MEESFKKCACCGQQLPLSSFNKSKQSQDGHYTYCRECVSKKNKERYENKKKKKNSSNPIEFHKPVVLNTELSRFQPRELINELRRRGYRGELKFTQVVSL